MGYVTIQGATQNLKASSSAPPTARLGTASSAQLSHNSRVPPRDISVKQDSCVPSTQVAERCSLKDETLNKSGNPTDLRTLKVRIKMNSDNTARKNVAIYSGLGLNSPSSSLENSPEESGDMPPPSQVTVDESPTNIVQVRSDVLVQFLFLWMDYDLVAFMGIFLFSVFLVVVTGYDFFPCSWRCVDITTS